MTVGTLEKLARKPRIYWDRERLLWALEVQFVGHPGFTMRFHVWANALGVASSYTRK